MNKYQNGNKSSVVNIISVISALTLAVFILLNSETASQSALSAIVLCGKTLIPTLFPFLIICGILMKCGFAEYLGGIIGKPIGKIFGIGRACSAALITGLICGFPTGAAASNCLYDQGLCDENSFQQTVLLSSTAAPAFVIFGIGGGMLGHIKLGTILWLIHVSSTAVTGLLFSVSNREKNKFNTVYNPIRKKQNLLSCISESVKESALSIISICGAVIFFSIPSGLISSLDFLPSYVKCMATSLFELTSGASMICSNMTAESAMIFLSAAISWSGMSVHAQIASVTDGKLNTLKFISAKALSALIAAIISIPVSHIILF